jgi:hypothetical protein
LSDQRTLFFDSSLVALRSFPFAQKIKGHSSLLSDRSIQKSDAPSSDSRSQFQRRGYEGKFLLMCFSTLFVANDKVLKLERVQEGQDFLRSYDSASRPPPFSQLPLFLSFPVSPASLLTREGERWSRIIRPQESLALCKSFNTLCCQPTGSDVCIHCKKIRADPYQKFVYHSLYYKIN